MPARNAASAVTIASVSAAIIAAAAALALRWRAKAAALTWRAGFAAGLAWSVIRSLGTRLRGSVKQGDGERPALVRDGLGAEAVRQSHPEQPPPCRARAREQLYIDL